MFYIWWTVIKENLNNLTKKRLLWLALFFMFLGLTFIELPFMQNSTVTPKWLAVSFLIIPLCFLKSERLTKINLSLFVWLTFVLQYGLQCFRSYNFWDSLVYIIPLTIVPIFIYLLANKIVDLKQFYHKLSLLIMIVIAPLLLVTLFELVGLLVSGDYNHASTYNFKYAFGHRNSFSQFIVLLVPLIISGFNRSKFQKRLIIVTVGLIYIIGVLLMNKTVLLILFGAYPAIIALFYLSRLSKKVKTIGIGLVVLMSVSVLGILASGKLNNTSYFGKLLTTDYGSGNERVRIWKNSYEIFKTEPLIGKGSGDWKIEILNTPLRFTQAEQSMIFYKRAHNDFIQIAVENGVLGLSLIVLFFVVVIIGLAKTKIDKNLKYTLIAGVLGFLVVMNTSFPLEKIELLMLLFLFLLPLFSLPAVNSSQFKLENILLPFNIIAFSGALIWCTKEASYFKNVIENNMANLIDLNLEVYSITPDVMPVQSIVATDYTLKNDYNNAIKFYEKALLHNPYHVHVLNGLGSSHYALGNLDQAKSYYDQALKVNPNFSETLLNYTALLFNNGDIDGALGKLLKVVIGWEPQNYYEFMVIITKAKCEWLIELHDEPYFEAFLKDVKEKDDVLYLISTNSRASGASYEDELRIYFSNN